MVSRIAIAGLFLLGAWYVVGVGSTLTKAWLAPVLIEHAWARMEAGADREEAKPWPWADTTPAARITFPSLEKDRVVLAGATARSMAFGPVLDDSGLVPVIYGHRDTHFRVLAELKLGDYVQMKRPGEVVHNYRVIDTAILDHRQISIPAYDTGEAIVLVTCYPFDAIQAGGELRYVVLATRKLNPVTDN